MNTPLRRYAFSERLAEILGESRRDLRLRVTLMVSDGLAPTGGRGPGSPLATPDYAADLLIGVMAAPQQVHTIEAIRCYRALVPGRLALDTAGGIVLGAPRRPDPGSIPALAMLADRPGFGDALARLLDLARRPDRRPTLAREVFGIWIGRGFAAAAIQLVATSSGRRSIVDQLYRLAEGSPLPAWLDPERGGAADPGLLHTAFLPIGKLIEIGMLTSPFPDERTSAVIDLGQKIANLAQLARDARDRRPWESFLSTAAVAEEQAERIDPRSRGLIEVAEFGANPGNLRMLTHVPEDLAPGSALVVVLHGCTQTAASYDTGTGWSTLADRHGFALLLPEQRRTNNPLRCFDWFREEDFRRDSGEPASIRQMIRRMVADHGIDRARIFVTGLSAGGAMTSVMLATYPEVFAGGAVLSGVPYRSAKGLQEGFEVIFQGRSKPASEWGDLVRDASAHAGPWPRVQVWHGDADTTVKPINALEVCKQWADVHGLPADPTGEEPVGGGHRRLVWRGEDGRERVELFRIAGMAHGAAVDPFGEDGCGKAGPFILDVGISSTGHIARSWGLTATRRERPAAPRTAAASPATAEGPTPRAAVEAAPKLGERGPETEPPRQEEAAGAAAADSGGAGARARARTGRAKQAYGTGGIDLAGMIARSLEAAARIKGASLGGEQPAGGLAGIGIDIPAILGKSFEAAGLIKGGATPSAAARTPPSIATVAGVDIGAILAKSFEAAGLLRGGGTPDSPPASPRRRPAAPATSATAEEADDWRSGEWELLAPEGAAPGEAPTLHGRVRSGVDGALGEKTRSISRRLALGRDPRLGYRRRLDIGAAANMLTMAAFRVLVDGEPVDEVVCTGMVYAEAGWTERAAIDLGRFADRTVTLAFEVTADANVGQEVWAEAWVGDVLVQDSLARPVYSTTPDLPADHPPS